ncbi:helix-turn-helix transcriptional regulator [Aliivibrio kagoshimensis]|uniref:helix-turn-helix transcriptional regulator n=1 Tax=Aliivibrio kagoshimensis TaxID=2910230 RepID=UPI003D104A36
MKSVDIILNTLKREGSVTAKKLSTDLKMTTMGVRQHLQSLEEEGLIAFHDVKVKVGRPTRHWTLTSIGHNKFTNSHGELTINFIDSVHDLFGEEGLQKVIDRREDKTLNHYQSHLNECTTLEQKLLTLTRLREQEGYMAELEKTEQGYRLLENHCPICHAAKRCPSLCQSEINIFNKLLGHQYLIERQEHIIQGQRRCVYQITEAR